MRYFDKIAPDVSLMKFLMIELGYIVVHGEAKYSDMKSTSDRVIVDRTTNRSLISKFHYPIGYRY